MSERLRLLVMATFWIAWAALGTAALHWGDHQPWGQVALFPVFIVSVGIVAEFRRRRLQKRSAPPPPLP